MSCGLDLAFRMIVGKVRVCKLRPSARFDISLSHSRKASAEPWKVARVMKFASYWHETSIPFDGGVRGPVSGDFDVAVIGAGPAGLAAADAAAAAGARAARAQVFCWSDDKV